MLDVLGAIFGIVGNAIYGLFWTILNIGQVLNFSEAENVFRFIYYGGSAELLALVLLTAIIVFVVGIFHRPFLWSVVRGIEAISNGVGRFFAYAGLIMVLQQILVIFLQSVFRVSDITIGPFGLDFDQPLGWYADGLKLYNAMVVCLCCAYTFVQGGHVRVDLFYASWGHRTKRVMDMAGTLILMLPALSLMWFYGWYYLWRHLINPNVSAFDSLKPLENLLRKAPAFRWNVETIAASPSGFNAYFLFKILLIAFVAMMILQAIGFFYRSWLEFREGPESAGKGLDKDTLEAHDDPAAAAAEDKEFA
jgi:TRAP-type mannitol/chloroaromatic compound transport system permease small subunit